MIEFFSQFCRPNVTALRCVAAVACGIGVTHHISGETATGLKESSLLILFGASQQTNRYSASIQNQVNLVVIGIETEVMRHTQLTLASVFFVFEVLFVFGFCVELLLRWRLLRSRLEVEKVTRDRFNPRRILLILMYIGRGVSH